RNSPGGLARAVNPLSPPHCQGLGEAWAPNHVTECRGGDGVRRPRPGAAGPRRTNDPRWPTPVWKAYAPALDRAVARHSLSDTTVTGFPLAWARIVSSTARAVSSDVRHGTLYSTAARRMRKPLLAGSRPR